MMRAVHSSCVVASFATLILAGPAVAATVTVTTGSDNPGVGCTLREAVATTNADADTGGCVRTALADPDDRIVFAPGVTTVRPEGAPGDDVNVGGDLDIAGPVTIDLDGVTIDARGNDRIFDVRAGGSLTLEGGTLTGGRTPVGATATTPGANGASASEGGAIRTGAGDVMLIETRVGGNTTGRGGAGADGDGGTPDAGNGGNGGNGGAIAASGNATITLLRAQLRDNTTGKGGAGGKAGTGTGDGGNGGWGGGGAAISGHANLVITDSLIDDNDAGSGATGGASTGDGDGDGGNGGRGGWGALEVKNQATSVQITRTVLRNNDAGDSGSGGEAGEPSGARGGSAFNGGAGGALAALGTAGQSITITGSTFSRNTSGNGGSGGRSVTGSANVGNSGGLGGAAYISTRGSVSVTETTFADNAAGDGGAGGARAAGGGNGGNGGAAGALMVFGASVATLRGVLVTRNRAGDGGAPGAGGSPVQGPGGQGGGIVRSIGTAGPLLIENSTITANATGVGSPVGEGGGVYAHVDGTTLRHATVSGNRAGGPAGTPENLASSPGEDIVVERSILHDGACADPAAVLVAEPATTLVDSATGCPGTPGAAMLRPLADNGGPTLTMALDPTSGARDQVAPDVTCGGTLTTDQRGPGFPRLRGVGCDAGAFEALFAPVITAPPSISGTPAVGSTLTCSGEVVSGVDVTVTRSWRRDGTPVAGATGSTYGVTDADAGRTLDCEATATNDTASVSAASGQVLVPTPPAPDPPTPAPDPVPTPPTVVVVPPAAAPAPIAPQAPAPVKFPAKLELLRAGVRDGRLDVRVAITGRATGSLRFAYRSSGRTFTFTQAIPAKASASGKAFSFTRRLPSAQRRKSTGILTITYAGNDLVRRDEVRLRAANGRARLERTKAQIDKAGNLVVEGTISRGAAGVVRVRLGYVDAAGQVRFFQSNTRIKTGKWALKAKLPADAARAGGQASIQFTGYERRRIRGEQAAKQILP